MYIYVFVYFDSRSLTTEESEHRRVDRRGWGGEGRRFRRVSVAISILLAASAWICVPRRSSSRECLSDRSDTPTCDIYRSSREILGLPLIIAFYSYSESKRASVRWEATQRGRLITKHAGSGSAKRGRFATVELIRARDEANPASGGRRERDES